MEIANDGRQEYEYYNLRTERGRLELDNTYATSSEFQVMKAKLLNDLAWTEMRAPLPISLRAAQASSKQQLIDYYLSQQS